MNLKKQDFFTFEIFEGDWGPTLKKNVFQSGCTKLWKLIIIFSRTRKPTQLIDLHKKESNKKKIEEFRLGGVNRGREEVGFLLYRQSPTEVGSVHNVALRLCT